MTDADELTRLLADWAIQHRLTDAQVAELHAHVLSSAQSEHTFSADWLWSLLRPVTALLDNLDDNERTPSRTRWTTTTYLQLA